MRLRRRTSPVRRTGPDAIALDLPPWVRELVADAADRVQHTAAQPGTAAFARLFAPIDESADVDDPLAVLARQTMLDERAAAVAGSAAQGVISDAQAEAWLQVLSLYLAVRAAELGVRTEEERDALAPEAQAGFDAVHALQLALIVALDAPAP